MYIIIIILHLFQIILLYILILILIQIYTNYIIAYGLTPSPDVSSIKDSPNVY